MCGGILTAMMFANPDLKKESKLNLFNRSLAYNFGRICSYSLAGLISGFLGSKIIGVSQNINAHLILQCLAALVLVSLALNILGYLPFKKLIESTGVKLWKAIQPIGKCLYPINSHWRAFLFGMVWGWLPCGLVYSALILSLSVGTPLDGMLTMLFFGLGTLPGMLVAGYFSSYLNKIKNNANLRIIAASSMLLIAISLPLSTLYFSKHHDGHSSSMETLHHH